MCEIVKPKCYDDRETYREFDKYMFISYAHLDQDQVYATLNLLYDKCLNFWYDKKLNAGDAWDEKVRDVIVNENCKGIILFMSKNSVKSAAVEKELCIYDQIVKERGRDNFKLITVSLNSMNANGAVRDAYVSLSSLKNSELDIHLPPERAINFLQKVTNTAIYVSKTDANYADKIIDSLKNFDSELFCSDDVALSKLDKLPITDKENGKTILSFGSYPQEKRTDVKPYLQNGEIKIKNKLYSVKNAIAFEHTPIQWIVTENDNQAVTAISKFALDRTKRADADDFINAFCEKAFDEEIRSSVISIELCSLQDLEKYAELLCPDEETPYCKSYGKTGFSTLLWLIDGNGEKVCYSSNGGKYTQKALPYGSDSLSCARLKIKININELISKNMTGEKYGTY